MKTKILLALALIGLVFFGAPRLTEETYTVTVNDKMVKNNVYLVYTDKKTFKIEDSIPYFRWNSSDYYGKIKRDTKYELTTIGFRFAAFSWYENIVNYKEIK